jgi:hypothetical protein
MHGDGKSAPLDLPFWPRREPPKLVTLRDLPPAGEEDPLSIIRKTH